MIDSPPVTAMALFFDDIRLEVTGKTILIGQYVGDLLLPAGAPPTDRLAILLNLRWPREYMPRALGVRVDIPGSPSIHQDLPAPAQPNFANKPSSPFAGVIMQGIVQLRFLPLRVGDLIDVWLKVDDTEIPAGRLRVADYAAAIAAAATAGTPDQIATVGI
jgi:hypothetical protein